MPALLQETLRNCLDASTNIHGLDDCQIILNCRQMTKPSIIASGLSKPPKSSAKHEKNPSNSDALEQLQSLLTQVKELNLHYQKSVQDSAQLITQIEALIRVSQSSPIIEVVQAKPKTVAKPILEGDLYLLGMEHLSAKKFEAALDCFNRLLQEKPKHLDAYCQKGNVLFELKRFDQALAAFEKAIQIEPKASAAYLSLGVTLHALGRYQDAIEVYQKALKITPEDFMVYRNMGNSYNELKNYDEALRQYDRAIEIKADYSALFFSKAMVLTNLGKTLGALDGYSKAIALDPQYADAHYYLGLTQMKMGALKKAIESFDQVLAINPHYDGVNLQRERALSSLNLSK